MTPLEQKLRLAVGEGTYSGSFVAQYIIPLVYPASLTREFQLGLGLLLVFLNILIYGYLLLKRKPVGPGRLFSTAQKMAMWASRGIRIHSIPLMKKNEKPTAPIRLSHRESGLIWIFSAQEYLRGN